MFGYQTLDCNLLPHFALDRNNGTLKIINLAPQNCQAFIDFLQSDAPSYAGITKVVLEGSTEGLAPSACTKMVEAFAQKDINWESFKLTAVQATQVSWALQNKRKALQEKVQQLEALVAEHHLMFSKR